MFFHWWRNRSINVTDTVNASLTELERGYGRNTMTAGIRYPATSSITGKQSREIGRAPHVATSGRIAVVHLVRRRNERRAQRAKRGAEWTRSAKIGDAV